MAVFQLAYLSVTTDQFEEDTDIDAILQVAHRKNADSGITGMLLYKGGVFLQLLEGGRNDVLNLFGRIAADLRHTNLKILAKQENQERLFPEWTMGYRKIEDIDIKQLNDIATWSTFMDKTKLGQTVPNKDIMDLFRNFRFHIGQEKAKEKTK
jgi:hypothetical protein